MIIVRLRGGLGNQLFQYAAAKTLAVYKGVELRSDLYTYSKHPYRKYELNNFNINLPEATREEVHQFTGSNFLIRYLNKRENYFHSPKVFAQPHYHFYEDFFNLPEPLYLSGYWQSEKYFSSIADELKKEMTIRSGWDQVNEELIKQIRSHQSVSVHVRRSDYVKNQQHGSSTFFAALSPDYYEGALVFVKEKIGEPHFYFFSDDINWCKTHFAHLRNAVFVDHNKGTDSYKDLLLMAECKHQVIANSTFSWWGAWLNKNKEKIVVAPKTWFRQNYLSKKEPVYPCRFYNTKDLIPNGWHKL